MLSYPLLGVDSAQWRPLYDLYAYSQDGKPSSSVSLHYRVNLSQTTGEDWNDAKLVLSTSETEILNAGIPTSDGLVIEPKPKPLSPTPSPPATARARMGSARFLSAVAEESSLESGDASESGDVAYCKTSVPVLACLPAAIALPEMSEGGAIISKSPVAVNYTVDELTTIPSDGDSHKVLVAIVPLEATISHITTPRKSPLAYLQVCLSPVSTRHPAHHAVAYSAR